MGWDVLEFVPRDSNGDKSAATLGNDVVSSARNVDFFTGTTRSLSEFAGMTVPIGAPLAMQYFETPAQRNIGYGHAAGVAIWDGATNFTVMPAAGLTGSLLWDMDAFGSWLVVTNDKATEAPHAKLPGPTLLAPIPGWQPTWDCKFIRTHRNVLFAADMTEGAQLYPNRLRWSSSSIQGGLPQTWVPAPSNDAGMIDLELAGGSILALCAVGDSIWVAGPGGIWVGRWQGGSYVYQFSQRTNNVGARGYRCMVSLGDGVAVLSRTDLVLMDEQSERSLLIGRYASVIATMSVAQLLYVESLRQLYVIYGTDQSTSYTRALIWDRDSDSWGERSFAESFTAFGKGLALTITSGRTWDAQTTNWDQQTQAWELPSVDAAIYMAANAQAISKPGGAVYNWMIQRISMPGPDGENIRVRSLEADIDGPIGQTVTLRLGVSQYPGESPTWGQQRNYTLGAGSVRHDDIVKGRYIAYQCGGTGRARVSAMRMYYTVNNAKP